MRAACDVVMRCVLLLVLLVLLLVCLVAGVARIAVGFVDTVIDALIECAVLTLLTRQKTRSFVDFATASQRSESRRTIRLPLCSTRRQRRRRQRSRDRHPTALRLRRGETPSSPTPTTPRQTAHTYPLPNNAFFNNTDAPRRRHSTLRTPPPEYSPRLRLRVPAQRARR